VPLLNILWWKVVVVIFITDFFGIESYFSHSNYILNNAALTGFKRVVHINPLTVILMAYLIP